MKNLTKSDLINIEAFKQLLKCVSNDIKDVKRGTAAASEKANQIMKLYRQRIQLINQAADKYPHINWLDESIGQETGFDRSLKDTIRMKIESKLGLN